MKVLIIGNGGRENTIAWKLSQSRLKPAIYATPFNAGIAELGTCVNIPGDHLDDLLNYAKAQKIDLTVVGPEIPLSLGIVDRFRAEGLKIFGPTQAAARLETSKGFAKGIMAKYNIPTARHRTFTSADGLEAFIRSFPIPPVVKADGLAAGKGVVMPQSHDEALTEAANMLSGRAFGDAGRSVVIEERMEGPEASIFAITDGRAFKTLPSAQDHKRAFDGDLGPNTGGMGAYAPASKFVDAKMMKKIEDTIIAPVLKGMEKEGIPYTGVLYAGIMLTQSGPRVIEFNCRFGDPETQALLPLLKSDLLEGFLASVENRMDQWVPEFYDGAAACVVLASGGYPGAYEKNKEIRNLPARGASPENGNRLFIWHAGTRSDEKGIYSAGGRVLNVVGQARDLAAALSIAYAAAGTISFEKKMYRTDIGKKGLP